MPCRTRSAAKDLVKEHDKRKRLAVEKTPAQQLNAVNRQKAPTSEAKRKKKICVESSNTGSANAEPRLERIRTRYGGRASGRTASVGDLAKYFGVSPKVTLPRQISPCLAVATCAFGRCLRTTVDNIKMGTILHTEEAFVSGLPRYRKEHYDTPSFVRRVRQVVATKLSNVNDPDKVLASKFINLYHDPSSDSEESRFLYNCFQNEVEDDKNDEVECYYEVWLDIAMANHSCRPNAMMLVDPDVEGRAILVAAADIPVRGSEVTINYIASEDLSAPELRREERREILKGTWNFDCTCEACSAHLDGMEEPSRTSRSSIAIRQSDASTSSSLSEVSSNGDDNLEHLDRLENLLGIHQNEAKYKGNSQLNVQNLDNWFSEYEALLTHERLSFRLFSTHEQALEAYRHHWMNGHRDDLTHAKILYHRQELIKHSIVCQGPDATAKLAKRFADELKRSIHPPRSKKRKAADVQEEPEPRDQRLKLGTKAINSGAVNMSNAAPQTPGKSIAKARRVPSIEPRSASKTSADVSRLQKSRQPYGTSDNPIAVADESGEDEIECLSHKLIFRLKRGKVVPRQQSKR